MYYTDYGRLIAALNKGWLKKEDGNFNAEQYVKPGSGFRFRFPFPDEDEKPLGNLGDNDFQRESGDKHNHAGANAPA